MMHEEMSEHSKDEGMKMGGHKSVAHKSSHTGEGTMSEMSNQELYDKCNKMTGHVEEDGPMGKTKEY